MKEAEVREAAIDAAKLAHKLHGLVVELSPNVGHGLLAAAFLVCTLSKSSERDISLDELISLLSSTHSMVEEADIERGVNGLH